MTEWKRVGYIKTSDSGPFEQHEWRYHLELPTPLADWDVWDYWERRRTEHMASILKPGDTLYDVGAENGWLSCVYARMVGASGMVLIEPSPRMWGNIRQTWEHNCGGPPLATVQELIGPTTSPDDGHGITIGGWPSAADGSLADSVAYAYLHEHADQIPTITLDAVAAAIDQPPTGITVDVEGAELLVLQGALFTLVEHRPHVWVSIHPDLMARDYQTTPDAVHSFMADLGYSGFHLATDHEEHWYFDPSGGAA